MQKFGTFEPKKKIQNKTTTIDPKWHKQPFCSNALFRNGVFTENQILRTQSYNGIHGSQLGELAVRSWE